MNSYRIKEARGFRWFAHAGKFGMGFELSRGWRGFIARWGYGGQEHFLKWCLAFPGLFLHLSVDTPWSLYKLRPFDGKYAEKEREFGVRMLGGSVWLLLGRDAMGTWHSTHGRFGWLRHGLLKNQEVILFSPTWITGRTTTEHHTLEERRYRLVIGEWAADEYDCTAKLERYDQHHRFKRWSHGGWWFDIDRPGIPDKGNPDCDFYDGDDAIFGIGSSSFDIEDAAQQVRERIINQRKGWRPQAVAS